MADNIDIKLTVEAWADIVLKEWFKMIERLNIGYSQQLVDSFMAKVLTDASGDPHKVMFAFEWYGRMVDYGVGKHVNLEDRDSMIAAGLTKRRPKPWLSDTFYKQLEVLRHLLEEKHARRIEFLVVRNLDDNADYGYNELKV
jgi:hypothetical protein